MVKSGSMDISMDPVSQTQEGDTMRTDEKRHKNMSGIRKNGKSKPSNSAPRDSSTAETHRPADVDKDKTSGMSFLIEYKLVAGELQGTITHKQINIQEEFSGFDQATIIQFMKRYLSKVEKSVRKVPSEEPPQPGEVKITSPGEMQKPGLEVIPAGCAQPSDILQQGQTFQLRWTFEPSKLSGITGKQMHCRIVVCGKNLERGERIHIGEGEEKIDVSGALTALIASEPLPPGTYIVEADAGFDLKSMKSDRQSACRARRLIKVM